ncbi:hypothetical protein CDAR_227401 [Caerostris darwini]|uniref:Uncharacterized protein n=1 Tax=Caerostris darwini TaxID=1538125 RepID=A0AAV4ULY5_9ARAC|nr:hypothetical protein CDAR_227401 [Caerostris darwini]
MKYKQKPRPEYSSQRMNYKEWGNKLPYLHPAPSRDPLFNSSGISLRLHIRIPHIWEKDLGEPFARKFCKFTTLRGNIEQGLGGGTRGGCSSKEVEKALPFPYKRLSRPKTVFCSKAERNKALIFSPKRKEKNVPVSTKMWRNSLFSAGDSAF